MSVVCKRWTPAEDAIIAEARTQGLGWRRVAALLPGRSVPACCDRGAKLGYAFRTGVGASPSQRRDEGLLSFNNPHAAEIGCRRLHEQHMRVHGGWRVAA